MHFYLSVFAAPDFEVEPLAVAQRIGIMTHVKIVLFIGESYDEIQIATFKVTIEVETPLSQSTD